MATNGAPDTWDMDEDMSNKMNSLNVNAPSFVPNVNAPAFVPSWGGPAPEDTPASTDNGDTGMQVDDPAAKSDTAAKAAPADSWEDKADMSSSATTPEDEDMSMEDDSGEKNDQSVMSEFGFFTKYYLNIVRRRG